MRNNYWKYLTYREKVLSVFIINNKDNKLSESVYKIVNERDNKNNSTDH